MFIEQNQLIFCAKDIKKITPFMFENETLIRVSSRFLIALIKNTLFVIRNVVFAFSD